MDRYARHIALPDIGLAGQEKLKNCCVVMVGAGGLGSAALPYLAAAGIGNITIIDHDSVSLSNLQRQTIFRTDQIGQNKAECARDYLLALNPDIKVFALTEKLTQKNGLTEFSERTPWHMAGNFDVILDGSDNFTAKLLLNELSLQTETPLISASVNGFSGQIGIYAGYQAGAACYRCLFPDLPAAAQNCNDAGVMGTAAGLTGLYQAHLALCFLLQIGPAKPGLFMDIDFKTMTHKLLHVSKDTTCPACAGANQKGVTPMPGDNTHIPLLHPSALAGKDCLIIDVRTAAELETKPMPPGAVHIELSSLPGRYSELPQDKLLAFACASNIRSHQAAAFTQAMGYDHVCVYDVLAK
jgi:molybdopterin/thiamine biosynthesis adenylyltransferase/rhodanese-related sulfurtransferase